MPASLRRIKSNRPKFRNWFPKKFFIVVRPTDWNRHIKSRNKRKYSDMTSACGIVQSSLKNFHIHSTLLLDLIVILSYFFSIILSITGNHQAFILYWSLRIEEWLHLGFQQQRDCQKPSQLDMQVEKWSNLE
jgi:hypothetical protein